MVRQPPARAIIMVDGGFCSVLNKYVLGRCIEKKLSLRVEYDLSWFQHKAVDSDGKRNRSFQFTKVFPHLPFVTARSADCRVYKRRFYFKNETPYIFSDALFKEQGPIYVDGYYEHWKYFRELQSELQKELSLDQLPMAGRNKETLTAIRGSKASVSVHIRRGDFVNLGLCFLDADYYLAAIDHVAGLTCSDRPEFFLFSNDPHWVEAHIVPRLVRRHRFTVIQHNDEHTGYLDLLLIAACDHQIASNASFGYWGGLLNRNTHKIVVIPDRWTPDGVGDHGAAAGAALAHRMPGWTVLCHKTYKVIDAM